MDSDFKLSRCANIPDPVKFSDSSFAEEELSFHLQARAVELKERIHRPFLFVAIHRRMAASEPQYPRLTRLVQQHLSACLRLIQHWDCSHRHHGTWLMVRQSFAAGLLLVAAHRAGLLPSEISPADCADALNTCLATLRYWEREAPDLRASRLILEDMTGDILELGH
jgi:hypothetical protein